MKGLKLTNTPECSGLTECLNSSKAYLEGYEHCKFVGRSVCGNFVLDIVVDGRNLFPMGKVVKSVTIPVSGIRYNPFATPFMMKHFGRDFCIKCDIEGCVTGLRPHEVYYIDFENLPNGAEVVEL
jgi:hypothetical protein